MPGFNKSIYFIPDALNAVISLSDDSLPNAIKVVIKIAIGTAREKIQAEFKKINLNTTPIGIPLPKNLSIFFKMKFDNKTKIKINNELKKGMVNSLKIYRCNNFI